MNYKETTEFLFSQLPMFERQGKDGYKSGLENTLELDSIYGHPHKAFKTIHVAGTNGKGTVSHSLAALLQNNGYKVGLYTSPHLVDFRERIRINGQSIPEADVAAFVTKHHALLEALQPSFFETMTAMAFAYFVREQVDIAVVEVGLGGRLDSTNVLHPILSVITNIGMDHTEFLGTTLTAIASEKAGIIKPRVTCIIGETNEETEPVFRERAAECKAELVFADQCEYLRQCRVRYATECELKGLYQEHNLQTAFVDLRALHIRHGAIAEGFANVCRMTGLRGRWETLQERPLVICDTGHNSHGLQYVARQLQTLPHPHIWIVFGMVNDKDTEVVMHLMPHGERYHYIFTTPNTQRARSAQEMLEIWGKEGIALENPKEAIQFAQEHAAEEDAIFIGGSNYLVSDAISRFTY